MPTKSRSRGHGPLLRVLPWANGKGSIKITFSRAWPVATGLMRRSAPWARINWNLQECISGNRDMIQPTNKPGHQALRRGRASRSGQIYNVTTATISRKPVFINYSAACAAARCFEDPHLLVDAGMLAWILMPDHVHWLIQIGVAVDLAAVVCRLKSASARRTNRILARSGALWQRAYYDHALRTDEDLIRVARYIVANPVRAGLVKRVGDYPFWNAVWL